MSVKVTVAFVGDPTTAPVVGRGFGMPLPRDYKRYQNLPKFETEATEDSTLGTVLKRAAEHWGVTPRQIGPRGLVASYGFYDPDRGSFPVEEERD